MGKTEPSDNTRTRYQGVFWSGATKKWVAQVIYNRSVHYIDQFEDEKEAALAVNQRCRALGIPILNPSLMEEQEFKEKKSKFNGVYFKTEEQAAAAVNAKCIELGLLIKNPNVIPDSS